MEARILNFLNNLKTGEKMEMYKTIDLFSHQVLNHRSFEPLSLLGSRNLRANTRKQDSASIAETCFREVNDVNVCFNTCYLRKASEFCFAEDCFFLRKLGWENSGGKIGCSAGVGATSRLWRSAGGILRGVLSLAFRPADRKSLKKFRIHTLKHRIHTFLALMMFDAFEHLMPLTTCTSCTC